MKRTISLLLSIIMVMSLFSGMVIAESTDLSAYALDGYYKKQVNNGWAEISLSDSTDENGVITSTASYSGELAAGKRIASFQPWADYQGVSANAAGAYTMHFGFTVNEITSPVYLEYNYSRNGGSKKTLISLSDSKVVSGGSISGSDFVEVTLPYTVNIFMNISTCEGSIYVNDQLLYQGGMRNSSNDKSWREVRVFSLEKSNDIRFVTTAANSSVYNDSVTIQDVIDAYIIKDEPEAEGIAAYALDGYYKKQVNNGWAEVSLSDSTDENGVITSTASYSGELAAGKRIGSFQPWAEYQGVSANAAGAYTMHFGFTVNEITSPVYLEYNYSRNGGSKKTLISLSDSKVVSGGSISGSNFVEVTLPYTVNIFMDISTCQGYIYVNDQLLYQGGMRNSSNDKSWREVRVFSLETSNNIRFVTTAANSSVYNDGITIQDVIDAYITKTEQSEYIWKYEGIQKSGIAALGYVDSSYSGDNENGYVLQAGSSISNANNGALGRFFLATADKTAVNGTTVLHQELSYTPTQVAEKHRFGIRGNNGYEWYMTFDNASKKILNSSGDAVMSWTMGETYDMDFIVDLSSYQYSWLVNGKVVSSGTVYSARRPLWQICYSMMTAGDSMTLKNITTVLYNSDRTYDDVLTENLKKIDVSFVTDANGYGDFEVENYEDCYDATAWRIYESRRLFSNSKALSVISENKNYPADNENPTLNLSFKAKKPGENKYYMWIRHTASVANQSGQNCYLSKTESGSYTTFTFTAEQNAPQWICLGNVTVKEGETGFVRIRHRQQNHIAIDRYVITTDAGFVPTDAYYGISPANSSTAYSIAASSFSNGRVSFEAESTTYTSPFEKYSVLSHFGTYGSSSNFSGGSGIITSSSASKSFTNTWTTDPHIEFNFTPPTSGTKYLWARMYSTTVNKDLAISVNCSEYNQFSPAKAEEWYWQLIYVIDGAQANLPVNVRLYNVSGGYGIDMFAISESVFDTPTGKITWTSQDSTLTSPYPQPTVTQSQVKALSHPRIYFTGDEVSSLKATLSSGENSSALTAHNANVTRGKNAKFTGTLAVVPGYSNNSASFLGVIESLALEYALKGDSEAGAKAVSSAMNYITTVSYAGIKSDEYTRVAGNDIAVLSRVYDWCYDLLTSEQKTKLIARCEEIAYQLEIGWPPANLSAVTGYGAEGSIQNHLLTFAIAVADERPDIYNYIVGRIENEFVPARKIMYESGASLQGTRYGTFRGQHDLTAVLLLNTIGYEKDIYGEGLKDLVNWYIYARRPDGILFVDGDDTNNGKTAGSYYTVGHMQKAFVIAARLFNDPYIKNEAKKATKNFSTFEYGESYLSPAAFLAINRPSLVAMAENGYPLSKFFGAPSGNLIARTGWNDSPSVTDNTAVAYMKTGEVNISNHQHLDAGNFQLYYKGILANDPTYYNDYNSEYMNLYAKRSVAHNTVLVRDGVSRSLNGHSIADGGQVPVTTPDNAADIKAVAKTEAYDFGGDDVNQPDYSYLKSDLTGAYSSSSVNDYNRSFMFLNMYDDQSPAALVVFDRLSTKNASHKTAWLLHGLNNPQISGSRATFSLNANGYTGKMTNDTLLPQNPSITSVEDGYVTAGGTKYSSGYNTSASGVNESDGYRIEVAPKTQSTLTYYLNVVQLSDSGTEVVTPSLIENDTFAGALIKDRVVLFSKSGDLLGADTSTSYLFNFADNSGYLCKIAVADVTEGTWEISYSADGTDASYKVVTNTATSRIGEDKGATITFAGMPGYYKIRRVSGEYTQKATEISTENEIKQLSPSVKVVDNKLYVAPRTYTSIFGESASGYNYKQVIAVYNESEDELLAVKIIDNFTETDKYGDYTELIDVDGLTEGAVIKTFLFEDMTLIKPVTDFGKVLYN